MNELAILLARYDPTDPPQQHGGAHVNHVNSIERDVYGDISHIYITLCDEEEEIYPPTIRSITEEQRRSRTYKPYFRTNRPKNKKLDQQISLKVIDDTEILVRYDNHLVILTAQMQKDILDRYHHYLQHPGATRLEETIKACMYWPGMTSQIRRHIKVCECCQKGKKRKVNMDKF